MVASLPPQRGLFQTWGPYEVLPKPQHRRQRGVHKNNGGLFCFGFLPRLTETLKHPILAALIPQRPPIMVLGLPRPVVASRRSWQ